MVAFVPTLVQLSYAGLRSIMSKYGRNRIAGIMKELKVDKATARKINETYQKVAKKGDVTQKLGGKNVVSNKNTVSVRVDKPQADVLKGNPITSIGGTGQKRNLIGTQQTTQNRTTPDSVRKSFGFPSANGQGFFASARDAGRQGMGFLSSPTGLTVGSLGLLGAAGMDAANPDQVVQQGTVSPDSQLVTVQNPDGSTSTRLMSTAGGGGSYRDQVRSGEIKLPMTEKSYNEFKKQYNIYNANSSAFDRATSSLTGNESDPRNKPQFANEAALFALEIDSRPENAGKFEIAFNAMKDAEKQATTPDAPSFSVEDARKQILSAQALTEQKDTPDPRFGDRTGANQFELIRGDDRNLIERTLGIGDEGVYVRKIYDNETGTYKTPKFGESGYEEISEADLVSGTSQDQYTYPVVGSDPLQDMVGENVLNAQGDVIGVQGPATSTTTTPDITTQVAGPNGQMLLKDQPSMAGNISNQAQIFGLANYLNSLAQNNNTFMGQQPNFNTGFLARPPMQQFYGTRKPGLFDKEFYGTRTGFF